MQRWGSRWCVDASVPDGRGGRVSQPSRSDADDPRCISIESLTRRAPPPPVLSAQLISKRSSGKTLPVTVDWMTALSRVDKRRGRGAANGMKMTKTDKGGRERGLGVKGWGVGHPGTHSASLLCCCIVVFFATVTLGMNHGVTHILPPSRVHLNQHCYLTSTHSKQEPLNGSTSGCFCCFVFLFVFLKPHAII